MKKGTGHRLLYATAALISLILLGAAIYYLQGRVTSLLLTPLSYGVKYPAVMLFGFAMMVVSTLCLKKVLMSEKSAVTPDKNFIKRRGLRRLITGVATLTLLLTLVGCGGGGAGSGNGGLIAGSALISWTAPITNEDDSILNDLEGYMLYYGTSSGVYTTSVDVGNVESSLVTGLTSGTTYYFVVTAYDTSRNESGYSTEVSKTIV